MSLNHQEPPNAGRVMVTRRFTSLEFQTTRVTTTWGNDTFSLRKPDTVRI